MGKSDKDHSPAEGKLSTKLYEIELERLYIELVKLQDWIRHTGMKVVVLFEGRDAQARAVLSNASRSH